MSLLTATVVSVQDPRVRGSLGQPQAPVQSYKHTGTRRFVNDFCDAMVAATCLTHIMRALTFSRKYATQTAVNDENTQISVFEQTGSMFAAIRTANFRYYSRSERTDVNLAVILWNADADPEALAGGEDSSSSGKRSGI